MAGIKTGPSTGFMSRFRQGIPGAVNAMAQNFGDPRMRDMNRMVGNSMMTSNRRPLFGGNPPTPTAGALPDTGIVRAPTMPRVMGPGIGMPFVGNGFFPNRNTGISGGMFGPSGPVISPMAMNDMSGPGLWQAYQQLSNEQGSPNRQMFY